MQFLIDGYLFQPIEGVQGDTNTRRISRIQVGKVGDSVFPEDLDKIMTILEKRFPVSEYILLRLKVVSSAGEDTVEVGITYSTIRRRAEKIWKLVPALEISRRLRLV
jgi:uncharacterized protein YrrD